MMTTLFPLAAFTGKASDGGLRPRALRIPCASSIVRGVFVFLEMGISIGDPYPCMPFHEKIEEA